MEAENRKFTDDELARALEKVGGMPTKAATLLGVKYETVYLRIRDNKDLQAVKTASRSRLFDEMQDLTISAIKTGVMPQLAAKKGKLLKDSAGNNITEHVRVYPETRLASAARLMAVLKSEAGIVDKSEVDHTSGGKVIDGIVLVD